MAAPRPVVAVACSGGRDSIALLHATCRAAPALGVDVVALHVHHGLLPEADAWQKALANTCRRWARRGAPLRLLCTRVTSTPAPGDSIEAWARDARYAALARMANDAGARTVLLAHHRRDQAETWLLQVLRGGGVAGQAAMPRQVERDGIAWLRPWLDRTPDDVAAYVRRHRLRHVHDPSNDDPGYARNRLRHRVWPALLDAFPQADAALAMAARWAQEALDVLDQVARDDLQSLVSADGSLDLAAWQSLAAARRSLALRHWLRDVTGAPAPASLVVRLQSEATGHIAASWPAPGGMLRAYRGRLAFDRQPVGGTATSVSQSAAHEASTVVCLESNRPCRIILPQGALEVAPCLQGGLAVPATLTLRARVGGERFQAGLERPPRDLRRQFQAMAVPAHARDVPLFYRDGLLAYVPGLGIDARCRAADGVPQVHLQWWPGAA